MRNYDKRTVYLDLKHDGKVAGNAGFVKVIVQNGQMRLTINIAGLHKTDTCNAKFIFVKGKKHISIDTLYIKEGRSVYSRLFTADELQSMEVEWDKVYSMLVKLDDGRTLEAVINPDAQGFTEENPTIEDTEKTEEGRFQDSVAIQREDIGEDIEKKDVKIEKQVEESESEIEIEAVRVCKESESNDKIYEDKWKQLESVFPHIHPFGDSRDFLSVKPKDFVVLTKEYQPLAGNSFLLHGYYNYNHIILGKIKCDSDKGDCSGDYYIGVPGVYYEREKAVAVMFGFDSFESNREPAATGTFGYYMKRVEI